MQINNLEELVNKGIIRKESLFQYITALKGCIEYEIEATIMISRGYLLLMKKMLKKYL